MPVIISVSAKGFLLQKALCQTGIQALLTNAENKSFSSTPSVTRFEGIAAEPQQEQISAGLLRSV